MYATPSTITTPPADITITAHGSLTLFHCHTPAVIEHLQDNTDAEAQWLGDALAAEPHYAEALAQTLAEEGFTIA